MKLQVLNMRNEKSGEVELPSQFTEYVNGDLIARAVLAIQSRKRHSYGSGPDAGKRASAKLSRRRHDYRASYGYGISRVPRKVFSRRGTQFNWAGAFAPGTVGGRRAHAPKARVWEKKINKKEERKALRAALSASMERDIVERKHIIPETYPFVVENKIEQIAKTKDLLLALKQLGMEKEIQRTKNRKRRSGKGKMRGRKQRAKRGLLIVVAKESDVIRAARNLPGLEVSDVHCLNVEALAPGAVPGRAVLFTQSAIDTIREERLFAK